MESRKQLSIIKESSLNIKQQLIFGLYSIFEIYDALIRGNKVIKKIILDDNWIGNISCISNYLSEKETDLLYQVFLDLQNIRDEMINSSVALEIIKMFFDKYFHNTYLDYCTTISKDSIDDIEGIISCEMQLVIERLKGLINNQRNSDFSQIIYNKQGKIRYVGEFNNNQLFNGYRLEYYKNGKLFF